MSARRPFFARDDRGLALVEFAIAAPVLLLLYLGGWQLSDALACRRKVTITARAVSDLTSQFASVTGAQEDSIIAAATQIMAPFSAANATIVVSDLHTDGSGNTTVAWSRASSNATARTQGSSFALPASMVSNNSDLIYGEVRYAYAPTALYGLTGPVTLADQVYMSPRLSSAVSWSS